MNLFERRRTLLASSPPLKPLIIYNGDIVSDGKWDYKAKLLNGYFDWNFSQQQTPSDRKVWKTEDFTIYLPEVKRYKTLNLICENNDIFSYEKNYKCFGVKKDSEWSNYSTFISCFDRYKEIIISNSREQTISIDISSWKGRMQIAFGTYFTSSGNDVSTNILKIWLE